MGWVSTLFVHKVVGAATAGEPSDSPRRRALFTSVGVDPDAGIDPKAMIRDAAYYALCERVMAEDPRGASIAVPVGASMRCDDYGAFGLAWKSAVDLMGSYRRAERYGRVLTSVSSYEVIDHGASIRMVLHRAGVRRPGLCISNEQTLVAVAQISREVCQRAFVPEAIFFQHPALDDTAALGDFFGCPVHHDADQDAIQVPRDLMAVPNRLGDPSISAFFDAHMEQELADLPDAAALDQRVRIQISQLLSEGTPSVSDVATRLGLSGRTLQRRLSDQGHAFKDLVDDARQDLAERLLRRTDYALAEVAFLTGFAEQSTFTRAFKRWHGQTPATFRQAAQAV